MTPVILGRAQRMFRYFARFYDHYDCPVYSLALCSYASPRRAAAHNHHLVVAQQAILHVQYQVVQLNHLARRDYLGHPNPLATAFMARMQMTRRERWRVKAAALKQMVGLPLNPEQRRMLAAFISIYLPLNQSEQIQFEADVAKLHPSNPQSWRTCYNSHRNSSYG